MNFPHFVLELEFQLHHTLEDFQFPGLGASEQENALIFFFFITPAPLKEVKEGEQKRLEAGEKEISETRGKSRPAESAFFSHSWS